VSPRTTRTYLDAVGLCAAFLERSGMPTRLDTITREHIEAFVAAELERVSPTSVHIRYRALQAFFKWAVSDGEIQVSRWSTCRRPLVPEQPVPVITPEQLAALLKACSGTAFADRRDLAIVRLLIDTGCRRAELTNLSTDDIDLRLRQATVTGKGRRVRTVAFGHKCAQALDRYARARAGHRDAHLPNLWLGLAGRSPTTASRRSFANARLMLGSTSA